MNFYKERLMESIFYLSEVYKVPYEVLAYIFGISRSSVYRLKKMMIEKKDLEKLKKEIKEKIMTYTLLSQKEFSELESLKKIY